MAGVFLGLLGIAAILGLAVALSTNRRAINPRIVLSAFALQVVIAALVLYLEAGRRAISGLSGGVQAVLDYSSVGIDMVFGPLASEEIGISFAVHVLPIIIFFSALMSVLYHLKIMQLVVALVGGLLRRIIGTQPVESLCAAANIFVGQTEAPLVIKPYLGRLTQAQLFTVMVSGLASVAGTVLAAYAKLGVNLEYLLAAAFMAAPGGLLMAKIVMPDDHAETEVAQDIIHPPEEGNPHANVMMAAAVGAQQGLKLAVNIGAMLIAFVALIALLNGGIGFIGGLFGASDLTIQGMLGFVFAPLMFLLNVPWSEAHVAGALFGEKLILNEFVAYVHFTSVAETLSPRTQAVVTFALCGFANLSSIAILLGGLGSLVPGRMADIARIGLRAVAAASLSNLMSAALAGLMLSF